MDLSGNCQPIGLLVAESSLNGFQSWGTFILVYFCTSCVNTLQSLMQSADKPPAMVSACLPAARPSCQALSLHRTLITDALQKRIFTFASNICSSLQYELQLLANYNKYIIYFSSPNEALKLHLWVSCLDGLISSSMLRLWLSLQNNTLPALAT